MIKRCMLHSALSIIDLLLISVSGKDRIPNVTTTLRHGLSQYLETGYPNRGFIDFCVSKVWNKVHTINKINPIYLHILLF